MDHKRRLELFKRVATDWTDAELVEVLTDRYEPSKIPPCVVCGGELSPQRIGGGHPTTWACSGRNEGKWLPGRSMADAHYERSEYIDRRQGGDEEVMELIRRLPLPLPLPSAAPGFVAALARNRAEAIEEAVSISGEVKIAALRAIVELDSIECDNNAPCVGPVERAIEALLPLASAAGGEDFDSKAALADALRGRQTPKHLNMNLADLQSTQAKLRSLLVADEVASVVYTYDDAGALTMRVALRNGDSFAFLIPPSAPMPPGYAKRLAHVRPDDGPVFVEFSLKELPDDIWRETYPGKSMLDVMVMWAQGLEPERLRRATLRRVSEN